LTALDGNFLTDIISMYYQVEVKVDQLWSDDIEVTKVTSGENIKAKVRTGTCRFFNIESAAFYFYFYEKL